MEFITNVIVIFVTSLIATFLSSMSGGGASIITIPVFLFLGMHYALAMAVQKVCSTFWVLPAAYNYLKEKKVDWTYLIIYTLIGLIGTIIGVITLLEINERLMKTIIGIIILMLVTYTALDKNLGLHKKEIKSKFRIIIGYLLAFPLGFYESIFGSGNGILFSVSGYHTRGFDMKEALGYYFAIAFFWVLVAAIMLIAKGYFNIYYMIIAIMGSLTGGYYGSKYGNYKGNAFIKGMFIIIGLILGLKLLLNI